MNTNQIAEERFLKIILSPVVSEKSSTIAELHNQYVFNVLKDAKKPEIKQAIEYLFDVKVKAVNVLNRKGKKKRSGQIMGRRSDTKKAYVSLQKGQSIDFVGKGLGA